MTHLRTNWVSVLDLCFQRLANKFQVVRCIYSSIDSLLILDAAVQRSLARVRTAWYMTKIFNTEFDFVRNDDKKKLYFDCCEMFCCMPARRAIRKLRMCEIIAGSLFNKINPQWISKNKISDCVSRFECRQTFIMIRHHSIEIRYL